MDTRPLAIHLLSALDNVTRDGHNDNATKDAVFDSVEHFFNEVLSANAYLTKLAFRHDVVFAAGTDTFPALKSVLVQNSEYFRQLFCTTKRKHVICRSSLSDIPFTSAELEAWPHSSSMEVVFFPDTDPEVLRVLVMLLFSAEARPDLCHSEYPQNLQKRLAALRKGGLTIDQAIDVADLAAHLQLNNVCAMLARFLSFCSAGTEDLEKRDKRVEQTLSMLHSLPAPEMKRRIMLSQTNQIRNCTCNSNQGAARTKGDENMQPELVQSDILVPPPYNTVMSSSTYQCDSAPDKTVINLCLQPWFGRLSMPQLCRMLQNVSHSKWAEPFVWTLPALQHIPSVSHTKSGDRATTSRVFEAGYDFALSRPYSWSSDLFAQELGEMADQPGGKYFRLDVFVGRHSVPSSNDEGEVSGSSKAEHNANGSGSPRDCVEDAGDGTQTEDADMRDCNAWPCIVSWKIRLLGSGSMMATTATPAASDMKELCDHVYGPGDSWGVEDFRYFEHSTEETDGESRSTDSSRDETATEKSMRLQRWLGLRLRLQASVSKLTRQVGLVRAWSRANGWVDSSSNGASGPQSLQHFLCQLIRKEKTQMEQLVGQRRDTAQGSRSSGTISVAHAPVDTVPTSSSGTTSSSESIRVNNLVERFRTTMGSYVTVGELLQEYVEELRVQGHVTDENGVHVGTPVGTESQATVPGRAVAENKSGDAVALPVVNLSVSEQAHRSTLALEQSIRDAEHAEHQKQSNPKRKLQQSSAQGHHLPIRPSGSRPSNIYHPAASRKEYSRVQNFAARGGSPTASYAQKLGPCFTPPKQTLTRAKDRPARKSGSKPLDMPALPQLPRGLGTAIASKSAVIQKRRQQPQQCKQSRRAHEQHEMGVLENSSQRQVSTANTTAAVESTHAFPQRPEPIDAPVEALRDDITGHLSSEDEGVDEENEPVMEQQAGQQAGQQCMDMIDAIVGKRSEESRSENGGDNSMYVSNSSYDASSSSSDSSISSTSSSRRPLPPPEPFPEPEPLPSGAEAIAIRPEGKVPVHSFRDSMRHGGRDRWFDSTTGRYVSEAEHQRLETKRKVLKQQESEQRRLSRERKLAKKQESRRASTRKGRSIQRTEPIRQTRPRPPLPPDDGQGLYPLPSSS